MTLEDEVKSLGPLVLQEKIGLLLLLHKRRNVADVVVDIEKIPSLLRFVRKHKLLKTMKGVKTKIKNRELLGLQLEPFPLSLPLKMTTTLFTTVRPLRRLKRIVYSSGIRGAVWISSSGKRQKSVAECSCVRNRRPSFTCCRIFRARCAASGL